MSEKTTAFAESQGASAIEVQNLTKNYGNLTAVDQLSLGIKKGEVFGFLGPNGAGKTTSIRMMVGLLKPTSGRVLIEGEEIEAISKGVKRKIGVCPQDIVVWDRLTCRENLLLLETCTKYSERFPGNAQRSFFRI